MCHDVEQPHAKQLKKRCSGMVFLYIWERSLGEDSLGDNAREGHHSKSAVGNFLQLHILNVRIRLAPEQAAIEAKISRGTSGPLQHLSDGNEINDLQQSEPKEHLRKTTLLHGCIVGSSSGDSLECLGDWKDTKATVHRDPSEPGHHADAAVLELGFAEEVDRGKVRKAEGVESNISDVSVAVWWGFEEGEGGGFGVHGGDGTSG